MKKANGKKSEWKKKKKKKLVCLTTYSHENENENSFSIAVVMCVLVGTVSCDVATSPDAKRRTTRKLTIIMSHDWINCSTA